MSLTADDRGPSFYEECPVDDTRGRQWGGGGPTTPPVVPFYVSEGRGVWGYPRSGGKRGVRKRHLDWKKSLGPPSFPSDSQSSFLLILVVGLASTRASTRRDPFTVPSLGDEMGLGTSGRFVPPFGRRAPHGADTGLVGHTLGTYYSGGSRSVGRTC